MLRPYLKLAFRNLRSQPGYSTITLFGLVIGFGACLLIAQWVAEELSYDRFHADADRIYRVIAERGEGDDTQISANTSYPIIPHLRADFPEIAAATRARRMFRPTVSHGERRFREERFYAVDSTFFDVFSYRLMRGDRSTALDAPDAAVLTSTAAQRYFGDDDPIGKRLLYKTGAEPVELTVTGVVADPPHNTHLHFDFLANIGGLGGPVDRWHVFVQNYSYVKLAPEAGAETLEAKFSDFISRYVGADLKPGEVFSLYLQPLTDIHLHSHLASEAEPNGNVLYVYLFSAVALFILVIACLNFVNLMTARAARRANEVGLRKAVGATRRQLIAQFLSEAMLLSVLSAAAALLGTFALLPVLSEVVGIGAAGFSVGWFGAATVVVALLVGLAAGAYPAFFLSSFQVAAVLRDSPTGGRRGALSRKALVAFQFAISTGLIAATLIVYDQLEYARSKDLGFDKEQIVAVPIDSPTGTAADHIKSLITRHPGVQHASASMLVPTTMPWTYNIGRTSATETVETGFYKVDYAFRKTYGLELVAGRDFRPKLAADSASAFIINEEAVQRLGFASPQEALDAELSFGDGSRIGRLIGVVGDFHATSLHHRIEPLVFFVEPEYYYLSARLEQGSIESALAHIRDVLHQTAPHLPFEYFFIDERFDELHRAEANLGRLFGLFAGTAILLAALGLIGLASHASEQRRKEIGVRKVLGASVASIVALLSSEFLKPVGAALLMGMPVAYLAMNEWLDRFAYRTEVGGWIFIAVGIAAVAAALLAVSVQSIRAAISDPVKSLRYE